MSDDVWAGVTFDGNRRRQQEEFMKLSFREKLEVLDRMAEVAAKLGGGSHAQSERSAPIVSTREGKPDRT
ncbi:MAG: hypothetical protein ABL963_16230 [Longimicrobiales bacterium]